MLFLTRQALFQELVQLRAEQVGVRNGQDERGLAALDAELHSVPGGNGTGFQYQ